MKVIGHDDEIMKEILALVAIDEEDTHEQVSCGGKLKQGSPLRGHRGDEKCAVHSPSVFLP